LPASKSSHAGIRKRFGRSRLSIPVWLDACRAKRGDPWRFATPESASAIFAISALIEVLETFEFFVAFVVRPGLARCV